MTARWQPAANAPPDFSMPSPSPLVVDPALFDPAAISAETLAVNADIVKRLNAEPPGMTIPQIRERRIQGIGAFPPAVKSPRAETITIAGPSGPMELRIIAAKNPRALYFHIHGGGWSIGAPDQNDPLLERIADVGGLTTISVKYRLGPEYPYPAGPDDCEAAALWIVREGTKRFGLSKLVIGGESAGGHLSAATLLRLRDRHQLSPFSAALLNYGCFDLGMTPSARNWGEEKLVLNTPAIVAFAKSFLPPGTDTKDPDVSPLYADLRGMPPAIFSVGTRDALLDDSLFMAPRWVASGNAADLQIHPGACHGFLSLPNRQRNDAVDRMKLFLDRYL
jgi:acetyl esterase/lipase